MSLRQAVRWQGDLSQREKQWNASDNQIQHSEFPLSGRPGTSFGVRRTWQDIRRDYERRAFRNSIGRPQGTNTRDANETP